MQAVLFLASVPVFLVVEYQATPDAVVLAIADRSTHVPSVVAELFHASAAAGALGAQGVQPSCGEAGEFSDRPPRWDSLSRARSDNDAALIENVVSSGRPMGPLTVSGRRSWVARAAVRLGDVTPGYAKLAPTLRDRRADARSVDPGGAGSNSRR